MRAEGEDVRRTRKRSNKQIAIGCGRDNAALRFDVAFARAHPSAASGGDLRDTPRCFPDALPGQR